MNMSWYRVYHGMPFDSKLAVIAKRCGARRGEVVAVWLAVLDCASQNEERRSTAGINAEEIAFSYDFDVEHVSNILQAFEDKGMIAGGRVAAWERRQVQREREDDSTGRVRKYRERQRQNAKPEETPNETPECESSRDVTPSNALDRRREEERRRETHRAEANCVCRQKRLT